MILDKQRPRWTGFTSGCSIPRRTMAKVLARALLPLREPRGGCLSSTVVLSMRPFPVPPARPLARNDDVGAQSLLCRVGSLQPSQEDGPVLVVPCHRADGTRPTPFYSILDSANQLSLPSLTLASPPLARLHDSEIYFARDSLLLALSLPFLVPSFHGTPFC